MLDRQRLNYKRFCRRYLSVCLYAFLILFCFKSLGGLELGGNIPDHLNMSASSNEKSSVPKGKEKNVEPETVGVVATVNGSPITVLDVLEVCGLQEARLPYMFKGSQLKEQVKSLRLKALNEVIDRKLVYQEFKENGYQLPKDFEEENIDRLMSALNVKSRQELEKLLKARGTTMAEFRKKAYENIAVDLLINERCFVDVYITPKHVYDYYLENKSKFTSPEEISLQVLKLKTDGVNNDELKTLSTHLDKILKDGNENEFSDAVLLYSDGPNIENGGDIGWIDKSKLRKDFLAYVKDADVEDVVGPVKSKEAYYFLRVFDIKREKSESFKQAKKGIKDMLTKERKEKDYNTYINNLRSKAYIKKYL